MKHAGGIAAAADAGDHDVRQPARLFETLRPRLRTDDRLKIADHHRKRVRPDDAADDVVRVGDRRHPIAHRLVDSVTERSAAALHRDDRGAEGAHFEDVKLLAADILLAHVNLALETE